MVLDPCVVIRATSAQGRPRSVEAAPSAAPRLPRPRGGVGPVTVNGTVGSVIFTLDRPYAIIGGT